MDIKTVSVKDRGSCNDCSRGKLKEDVVGIDYPYENVFELTLKSISVRLCDECLKKLKTKLEGL